LNIWDEHPMSVELSLLILTYNKENEIKLILRSLELQKADAKNWELIIIDDGSTDNTVDEINKFAGLLPLKLFRLEHTGNRGYNRNFGINQCRGIHLYHKESIHERDYYKNLLLFYKKHRYNTVEVFLLSVLLTAYELLEAFENCNDKQSDIELRDIDGMFNQMWEGYLRKYFKDVITVFWDDLWEKNEKKYKNIRITEKNMAQDELAGIIRSSDLNICLHPPLFLLMSMACNARAATHEFCNIYAFSENKNISYIKTRICSGFMHDMNIIPLEKIVDYKADFIPVYELEANSLKELLRREYEQWKKNKFSPGGDGIDKKSLKQISVEHAGDKLIGILKKYNK
jgi:glycosyltransferase involved in cell wall biosynthesis